MKQVCRVELVTIKIILSLEWIRDDDEISYIQSGKEKYSLDSVRKNMTPLPRAHERLLCTPRHVTGNHTRRGE